MNLLLAHWRRKRLRFLIWPGAWLAAGLIAGAPVYANVPGGGTSGASVTVSSNSTTVMLSNGIISANINITSAEVLSLKFNGTETVGQTSDNNKIYFSMDGGTSFEVPHHCVYTLTTSTSDMVDVKFKQTYVSGNASYIHACDIEIHYVLRRGATGLYVYAILDHPASYPALSVGEWRMVWKHPHDSVNFFFEKQYVDDFRHHDMPTYYEHSHGTTSRIAEIAYMNAPPPGTPASTRVGTYNSKYEFSQEYAAYGAWGHASDTNQKGVWVIPGSFEFFNDGPTKQDLITAESYTLIHFGRNHYGGSSTNVPNGTAWSKVFGPYLLYCNGGNNADALWADAQAQAMAEQGAWPYLWLTGNPLYPLSTQRGRVTGRFIVNDSFKPAVSGANAWVGLATPDGSGSYNWQSDSLNYQYWARADGSGNFSIPSVRPGTYTLYAFNDGVTGEYSQASITVSAGQTLALGNVTWNVVHPGNWLAWEIGVPDRTAKEFRHGTSDYYVPYVWLNFVNEFTNPLNFNVGSGNWATEINYVHGYLETGGSASAVGSLALWPWNINFNLDAVPASGTAVLTIAFAGQQGGHLRIWVNRALTSNPNFDFTSFTGTAGNALLREGVHTKYEVHTYSFAVSNLRVGSNTITLQHTNGSASEGNHEMYDYISLEMPGSAPTAQPAVGRAFTWRGGNGNNSWDVGTFLNWTNSGGNATFNQGDVVTLDDSGSHSPAIVLNGALKPNGVTITGTQNYTFTGSGCITGATGLLKSGTGTLTLNNSGVNTYTGNTTIAAGTLQLNSALSNAGGVVVQSGGVLVVGANLTTGVLSVNSGGTLVGSSGNLNASVINTGTMLLAAGGVYHVNGSLTNNNLLRITNGTQLAVTGAFVNNGVVDIITGAQNLPAGFVNNGIVLDSSTVKVDSIAVVDYSVQVTAQSYAGHDYQLQWSASLTAPSWQDVGSAQPGTGGLLTFVDSSGVPVGPSFYRIQVAP